LGARGCFDLNKMGFLPHPALEEFLWLYFCDLDLRKIYDGSNVPQINHGDIADIPLVVPSQAEGEEIARRVDDLLSTSENEAGVIDNSDKDITALRQSVLKAAFEGRLVPQDPNDEPASVLLAGLHSSNQLIATRRRRARVSTKSPQPSFPGLYLQSMDPQVRPTSDD